MFAVHMRYLFLPLIFCACRLLGHSPAVYIDTYALLAISEMDRTGIPASITLAQAIQESNWGKADLAIHANNFFGIKCKQWSGDTYYKKDDEFHKGELIESCFRVYNDVRQSFVDHSNFLIENPRYQKLFQLNKTDYKGWAKGLQDCGYATDKQYAEKLISTIEKFDLHRLDLEPALASVFPATVPTPTPTLSASPAWEQIPAKQKQNPSHPTDNQTDIPAYFTLPRED
jgi:hypothetical protein